MTCRQKSSGHKEESRHAASFEACKSYLTSSIPPDLSAEDGSLFLEYLRKTTEPIDCHARIVL